MMTSGAPYIMPCMTL